jgi:hypothetical protein
VLTEGFPSSRNEEDHMERVRNVRSMAEKGNICLYVGQSWELKSRVIDQHGNPSYRRSNPSLHYCALEKSDFDFYISFSECELNDPDLSIRQKKLNILEVSENEL